MGRRVYLVAMVAVGLIISTVAIGVGLVLLTPSGDGPPGIPSASEARDAYTSLSGLAMTRVTTVEYANGTERTTRARIRLRPNGNAVFVRWQEPDAIAGTVVVANATTRTIYRPDRGTVTRQSGSRTTAARVAYVNFLDGAFTDDPSATGAVVPAGTSPVPVLPERGPGREQLVFDTVHRVSYRGNATVGGRETVVLHLETATDRRNVTVWLGRRHMVPVKVRVAVGNASTRRVTTVRHTDIRFDPGFDDETFSFEPPADADVTGGDPTPTVETFDSIAAANASAPFRVPEVDPPGELRFGRAQLVRNETRPTITLQYRPQTMTNGSAVLLVTKAPVRPGTALSPAGGTDTRIRVAGRPAFYSPSAGGYDLRSVRWRCSGYAYSVVGNANRSTTITMAERIGCG